MKLMFAALIASILVASIAMAGGPPEGEDPTTWCDANLDECTTWCESNPEAEICKEPECD